MAAPVSQANTAYMRAIQGVGSSSLSNSVSMKTGLSDFHKTLEVANAAYGGRAVNIQKYNTDAAYKIGKFVSSSVSNVRDTLLKSEDISAKSLVKEANMSDVVTAITNADIALQTIVAVRDKIISSYMDIIKMQI